MKSLSLLKLRIPIPPIGSIFKTNKDYDRKQNKRIIKRESENDL